jgi:hypothetical protein
MGYPNIIQNHTNDINVIKSTYFSSSGHIMTRTNTKFHDFSGDKYKGFEIAVGGQHESTGASLNLYHKDSPNSPGSFFLTACDGTNISTLWASPSGILNWNTEQIATRHIPLYPASSSEKHPVNNQLCVIRGTTDNAPNNSCILSFGAADAWFGQLCIVDNAEQGIWRRGTSDNVMGDWYRLLDNGFVAAYITSYYHNGSSWYRVWSDGWIEQGGLIWCGYTDTHQSFSYPLAFRDNNYVLNISMHSSTTTVNKGHSDWIQDKGTTWCNLHLDTYPGTMNWYACGY